MILVRVTFSDWDRFWAQFTSAGAALRARHGSRGVQVLRDPAEPTAAVLLFDWDADAFAAFRADPEVQASMRAGGAAGPPAAQVLDAVAVLEA